MEAIIILIFIFIIILIVIKLFFNIESFDNCYLYNNNYNKCYKNKCTVMIDLKGNSVCLNK
jgi:hypothetical protein